MQKPKICFVSLSIYPLLKRNSHLNSIGGAELQQLLIGKELLKRGHQITYITMDHGQKEIENIGSFNVISTFKPGEGLPVIRFFYPRLVKIWKALCKSDADIFYVRCAGYILAPVVLCAKLHKKKVIYCGANDPDFDPKRLRLPVNYRDKFMYFWGLRRCDAIVAQNKKQQKLLLKNFHKNAPIIHNGFAAANHALSLRRDILWVANFKKQKNPHLFLELAKRFPNEKFVMIGGKASSQPQIYDDLAKKAKKIPNLDFKGFLPFQEVEKQFRYATLLINTSEHEGFPNTFLQAWARGIPVISFVDPDDLIKKNHLGLVVKDLDEMTQKVKEILENRIKVSSQKIKTCFEQNFTIEKIIDKYESLFASLHNEK